MKPIDEYLLLGLVERCSWFNHAPKIIGIYADEPDLVERLIRVCWPDVTCVFWQEGQVPPVEGVVMASVWVGALNITKMCDNISSWVMPGGWLHWLALGDPSFSECGQEGVWPTAEAYCQTLHNIDGVMWFYHKSVRSFVMNKHHRAYEILKHYVPSSYPLIRVRR